jgi:hypothetical protein
VGVASARKNELQATQPAISPASLSEAGIQSKSGSIFIRQLGFALLPALVVG